MFSQIPSTITQASRIIFVDKRIYLSSHRSPTKYTKQDITEFILGFWQVYDTSKNSDETRTGSGASYRFIIVLPCYIDQGLSIHNRHTH